MDCGAGTLPEAVRAVKRREDETHVLAYRNAESACSCVQRAGAERERPPNGREKAGSPFAVWLRRQSSETLSVIGLEDWV